MFECRQVNFIYLEFSITEDSIILCGNFKASTFYGFSLIAPTKPRLS